MLGVDDLVLVSVDDHLIEPPDLFVDHLDARYLDRAPKLARNDEGGVLASINWHIVEWCGAFPGRFIPMRDEAMVGALRARAAGHDVSVVSRSTRVRTADEKLEGFRSRARRAVAAGTAR